MHRQFCEGRLGANTYVVWNENREPGGRYEAMIIDTGNPVDTIEPFIKKEDLEIKYIVLTHGHYDHVCFINEYKEAFPSAKTVCHENEAVVLLDSEANVSELFRDPHAYPECEIKVSDGDVLELKGSEPDGGDALCFTVIHTPGHTVGSMCLYCEQRKIMFTGDTLFAGGYGRTDFKYGNGADMQRSLRKLLAMDMDIVFYSGHGESSTIGWEEQVLRY